MIRGTPAEESHQMPMIRGTSDEESHQKPMFRRTSDEESRSVNVKVAGVKLFSLTSPSAAEEDTAILHFRVAVGMVVASILVVVWIIAFGHTRPTDTVKA